MFESLIKYVADCKPEDVASIDIEEMAIASAWYESHSSNPEKQKPFAKIPELVEYWLEHTGKEPIVTEGRRLQPLLREILDKAVVEGVGKLNRSEMDLLDAACDLADRAAQEGLFDRLHKYFETQIDAIRNARENLEVSPGLPGLEHRLHIITPEDIQAAPKRSVATFAGTKIAGRGPVYSHAGNLKVMGFVPDECMLVVEAGSCLVHGHVYGRVAATNDCEIRENIAGVVVSSLGDIRAKNALTQSFIVSKWGNTVVRSTENPKLLFAGKQITIREKAFGGSYVSPTIRVENQVSSGNYNFSKTFEAGLLQNTDTQKLIISLTRTITPDEYGGLADPAAARLLSIIRRKRQKKENWVSMIALAQSEIDQFSRNAAAFLTGGENVLEDIERLDTAEREMAFLDRLISTMDALSLKVEEELAASEAKIDPRDTNALREYTASVEDLKNEMFDIAHDDNLGSEVATQREDLDAILSEVSNYDADASLPSALLFSVRDYRERWMSKRERIFESSNQKRVTLSKLFGPAKNTDTDGELSNMKILSRVLTAAYGRPPGNPLRERTNTNFIKLILKSIEKRQARITNNRKALELLDKDLERLGRQLEREARIPLPPEPTHTKEPPIVTGVFEPGVTLCTERYLLDEKILPEQTVVLTADTGKETVSYIRKNNRIFRAGGR